MSDVRSLLGGRLRGETESARPGAWTLEALCARAPAGPVPHAAGPAGVSLGLVLR